MDLMGSKGDWRMKTIIAGSRTITDIDVVRRAEQQSRFTMGEVVSGCAAGVDRLGEQLAAELGLPVRRFPADWEKHGRAAGPIRNLRMAEYADALIAVWDGKSRGTKNMIDTAQQLGLSVYVCVVHGTNVKPLRRIVG